MPLMFSFSNGSLNMKHSCSSSGTVGIRASIKDQEDRTGDCSHIPFLPPTPIISITFLIRMENDGELWQS